MIYLASDPIYVQSFEEIDAENGVIKGVKVCSEGDAKGHGVFLNKQFIRNVVKFGREQTVGVKARFGHPNMCDTTLGTYIGRFKNFKTVGEENKDFEELGKPRKSGNRLHAVADIHFDDTANDLPKLGNVKDYLTKLAESSPDMFGSSIVFHMGEGETHKWKDDDGEERQRHDATIESLLAVDLVDSPAATEGLFSEFSSDEMAIQVTHFLDQHPEVYELAANHPEIVEQFMNRYAEYKSVKETVELSEVSNENQIIEIMNKKLTEGFESLKTWFAEKFKGEETSIPEEAQEKLNELEAQIAEVGNQEDRVTELEASVDSITLERDTAVTDLTTMTGELETASARILELEGDLTKAKAPSTKPKGKEGGEDLDKLGGDTLHTQLAADLIKIKGE